MRDERELEAPASVGELRTGALLAAAGALLLASTLTQLWTGPTVVAGALAVALLVVGGYLLVLRSRAGALERDASIRYFDGHPEPVLLTDLDGRVTARNPAARLAGESVELAGAARYRLTREARLNGAASEPTPDGLQRLVVTRHGPDALLWRLERTPARAPNAGFEQAGIPWLRIDAEGRVLAANPAAAALTDGQAELDRILADLPLRPDGVHVLAGSGQAVRAVVMPGPEDRRDLLLMPLDGAEVSGLVPDHFLDELPVALARLETERPAHLRQQGRPPAPRRRRRARRQHRRPARRPRPADGRAARRHHPRPRPRPLRGRPRHRRRPGDLPAGRLHPHRARRRAVAARRALRRDRAQDPRGAVRAEPEDAGGRPARRRRRPRLQQPADRDQRPLRPPADAPRRRRRRARRPDADPPERQPRRGARPPAPRLLAQADPAPDRHQPPGHALRARPPPQPAPDRQGGAEDRARPRPRAGPRRRAPDRAGDHEPRRQRPRRDAARRRGPDHHPQRAPEPRPAPRPRGDPEGRLRGDRGRRLGPRHPRGQAQQDLRAVLHHQAGRRGHRPRALHRLRHRQADRRLHLRRQPAGAGGDLHHLPAGLRQGRPRPAAGARAAPAARPHRARPGAPRRGRGRGALVRRARAAAPRLHGDRGELRRGGARRSSRTRACTSTSWSPT